MRNKQQAIIRIYRQYKTVIIYGLIGINIFGMIVAAQTYVNYRTIQTSIQEVQEQTQNIRLQNLYEQKFLQPYLESSYAPYFLAHENNRIVPGEKIIRLSQPSNTISSDTDTASVSLPSTAQEEKTPPQAWQHFFWERWEQNER